MKWCSISPSSNQKLSTMVVGANAMCILVSKSPHCLGIVKLENCQGVRRTADCSGNIQRTASQQERVALLLCAGPGESLEIPKLADVQAEEAEEVLVKHCGNNPVLVHHRTNLNMNRKTGETQRRKM